MLQEMITDWRFWAFVVTILGLLVNWLATHKLTTNHVAHMDEKLDKISGQVSDLSKDFGKFKTHTVKDIAVLKEKTKDL